MMDAALDPIIRATEDAAAELLAPGTTPGVAVALVRGGQPAWSGGYGMADPFSGRPMTPDRLFRVASITKTFVAVAVAQLRDEGRLSFDDPLTDHLPEIAAIEDPFGAAGRITIGQVLLHVAGLQTDAPTDPGDDPGVHQDELLRRLPRARFVRPPQTRWHYSNLGYELLGVLIARLAGEPTADRITRTVLAPAGLAETAYHPGPDLLARAAVACLSGPAPRTWERAPDLDSDTMLGDGGLWSTVGDLARWIAVQCLVADTDRRGDGPRVLDGPSLRELQRPQVLVDLEAWRSAQGLGFASFRVDDDAWQGHTGSLHGLRAIHLFRASDGLGVVALANGSDRPNPVAFAAARALLAAHRAATPATTPTTPTTPTVIPTPGTGPTGRWRQPALGVTCTAWLEGPDLCLLTEGEPDVLRLRPAETPDEWVVGDEHADRGERMRWFPAADGRPEILQDGAWSMVRATD
jgi:CubicO group peptidase (beta-lactamase class C family)